MLVLSTSEMSVNDASRIFNDAPRVVIELSVSDATIWSITVVIKHHDTQHNDTQYYDTQHNDTQHNDTQHHDTQHNDTQHYDTQHYDTQHNDTQHYDTQHNVTLPLCCVSLY